MLDDRAEVLVVGAGPAGCTIATILAREGHSVLLLEREEFPRFRDGEWMPPSVQEVWDRIGFSMPTSVRAHRSSAVRVVCERTGRMHEWSLGAATAFSVPRAAFDQQLLQHAVRSGVHVRERCEVLEASVEAGVVVGVRVREASGLLRVIRARMVVDASGREALLATRLSQRVALGAGRSLLQGYFVTGQRGPGMCEVVLFPHGWCWRLPLAGGVESVGVLFSPRWAAARRSGEANEVFFARTLQDAPRMQSVLAGARALGTLRSVPQIGARSQQLTGRGWVAVGTAAVSVEPLFGYPQAFAMHSAMVAAKAVHEALSKEDAPGCPSYADAMERALRVLPEELEGIVLGASGERLLTGQGIDNEQSERLQQLLQASFALPTSNTP